MNGAGVTKRKVCILGAGPGGLSAAWALSSPELRERFAVEVYQMGWRAGGRAASAQNPDKGNRIEQNGSHYLFGSYRNTFKLVRAVYDELGPSSPFGRIEDEFTPRNLLVGKRHLPDNTWEDWFQFMPTNLSRPDEGGKYARPFDYCLMAFQTVLRILLGVFDYGNDPARTARWVTWMFPISPFKQDKPADNKKSAILRAVLAIPAFLVNYPLAWMLRGAWRAASFCYQRFLSTYTKFRIKEAAVGWFKASTVTWRGRIRNIWREIHAFAVRNSLGHAWVGRIERLTTLWEVACAFAVGVATDELWRAGRLDQIDGLDFRAWLTRNGCAPEAVQSAYIKCWYDAVAAYEDGDVARPSISAAVSAYAVFRAILTYRGNFAYQMRHEVGDGVIAPLVSALMNRGVQFHFFQRVRDVVPAVVERKSVVDRIELEPQLADGVHGADCFERRPGDRRLYWRYAPSLEGDTTRFPSAEQLPGLESFYGADSGRRRTLRRGEHFDDVVFALPLPAIEHDARSLLCRPEWKRMVTTIKSTETVSLRIWFTWTLEQLGWTDPAPILSGYDSPFSTWEDNGHNADRATFPPDQTPQAIATVFGPLEAPPFAPGPGPGGDTYLRDQTARAKAKVDEFFRSGIGNLWSKLFKGDQLRYDAFCDLSTPPVPLDDARRLQWQLIRANVGPIERYTLALPSTLQDRLRPDESGYANMVLAGEWTRNGVEVGCMEGAVISGLAAARALCDRPVEIVGEHDLEFGLLAPAVGSQIEPDPEARRIHMT